MKGVMCDPLLPRNLDLTALAQYMRFQQVLGVRTFFEEIRLLPGASVMTLLAGSLISTLVGLW
jgi:hypothetical protein